MATAAQSSNEQPASAKERWRRRMMLYLIIPLCWFLLALLIPSFVGLIWFALCVAYLGLLYILTFTTLLPEDRSPDKLMDWRQALSASGRLAFGGLLIFLYGFIYVLIISLPDAMTMR